MFEAIYFFLLIFWTTSCIHAKTINCPLVWVSLSFSEGLPEYVLPTHKFSESDYIVRVNQSGKFRSGRFDKRTGKAYFISDNSVLIYNTYEILTNPHGCLIQWSPRLVDDKEPVEFEKEKYVGRGLIPNKDLLLAGEISQNLISIIGEDFNKIHKSTIDFEYLLSYSMGLSNHVTQFTFDGNIFDVGYDFVGVDEILNRGNVEISQTVIFKKRVLESTTLASSRFSSSTTKVDFSIQGELDMAGGTGLISLPSPTLELGYESSSSKNSSNEYKSEFETVVEIKRTITVPPYTEVQACGTITMANNFDVNYVARGRYTGLGLNSEEVKSILKNDGIINGMTDGNGILVEEFGNFKGTLAMTTTLIVLPIDSPTGCAELGKAIFALNNPKYQDNRAKMLQIKNDLFNILKVIQNYSMIE